MWVDGLPEEVWCGVLHYLTLRERQCVLASCVTLWQSSSQAQAQPQQQRTAWNATTASLMRTHTVHEAVESTLSPRIWQGLGGSFVVFLHMGPHATNEMLKYCGTAFPSLQHLTMIHSQQITDQGLWDLSLATNHDNATTHPLKLLDITYCRNTTYGGTLCLRRNSLSSPPDTTAGRRNNEILIRRQPACLDGRFVTPFQDGREGQEIHTYWADGSFSFERASQSEGFVCDLWPWSVDNNNDDSTTAMGISATYGTNANDENHQDSQQQQQQQQQQLLDGHLFLGDKL